jgi:hypothetical protein
MSAIATLARQAAYAAAGYRIEKTAAEGLMGGLDPGDKPKPDAAGKAKPSNPGAKYAGGSDWKKPQPKAPSWEGRTSRGDMMSPGGKPGEAASKIPETVKSIAGPAQEALNKGASKLGGPAPQLKIPGPGPALGGGGGAGAKVEEMMGKPHFMEMATKLLGRIGRKGKIGLAAGAGAAALGGGAYLASRGGPAPAPANGPAEAALNQSIAQAQAPKPQVPGQIPGQTPGATAQPQQAGFGGSIMQTGKDLAGWAGNNPGQAALLGLGVPAAAYGMSQLFNGKKKEKQAGDFFGGLPRNRAELAHEVQEVVRHNSTVILNRFMDKMAADAGPRTAVAFRTVQAGVLLGDTLDNALMAAFPKMASDKRIRFAKGLCKVALDDFLKTAAFPGCEKKPRSVMGKTFHGSPGEGHAWMKEHA